MPEPMLSTTDFAKEIKAKYPVYASVPDDQLVTKMLDKYPVYKDRVQTTPMPDMSTVKTGQGKTFTDGPFKGQTWALDDAGKSYQVKVGNERNRPDNSLLGLPPELAVVSALKMGSAVSGGVGLTGKALSAGKEAITQVAPVVKYEAVKAGLEHLHVPSPLAITIALAVSGYHRGGGKTAAAKATTVAEAAAPEVATVAAEAPAVRPAAAPVSPVASAPASPAPPAAPVVRASAPVSTPELPPSSPAAPRQAMSPQRIKNEVMLAARRQKLTLSDAEYQAADALVQQGQAALDAVRAIRAGGTPAAPVAAPVEAAAVPSKLKLSYSELNEYHRLTKGGMSHTDAAKLIETQRALLKTFGTPSTEDVIRSVVDRNTSGTWKK